MAPDTLFIDTGTSASFTVTLSEPAAPGGELVSVTTNTGNASAPGSITIPQGLSSGEILVDGLLAGQDL